MQRLLDRELTSEELAERALIRKVFLSHHAIRATVGQMADEDPELFFAAALDLLESEPDPRLFPSLHSTVFDCPQFLIRLMSPERFGRDRVLETCRRFLNFDTRLDIRIARLVPGRSEDPYQLQPPHIVRILDILNEISAGPKLVLIMNHLTGHADLQVACKAIILMGRRIQNSAWVDRHFQSADARKRASVVEALWRRNNAWARRIMWIALEDDNNRVVGNALVGLHFLGEHKVDELVRSMLRDPRVNFRFTAAWVMGKLGDLEYLEPLRRALADPDQRVRQAARRALVTIRRPILRQQQAIALAAAVEADASYDKTASPAPTEAATVEPEEKEQPKFPQFRLLDDS